MTTPVLDIYHNSPILLTYLKIHRFRIDNKS